MTYPLDVFGGCEQWETLSEEIQQRATTSAEWLIWALSGRRFATTQVTVRPTFPPGPPQLPTNVSSWWTPGVAVLWAPIFCPQSTPMIALPGPVVSVDSVVVDGQVLAPGAYELLNGRYLARTDSLTSGIAGWALNQNVLTPSTEVGTLAVTYTMGELLPDAGLVCAELLACEFGKAFATPDACTLPERVQRITRQGIELDLVDVTALTTDGLTGIREVDLWLYSVNPAKLAQGAQVWSPDLQPMWRVG